MGWKSTVAKVGFWVVRTLIREGREELAKFAVDEVLKDEKIPHVNDVGTFIRNNFPVRTGKRGL